MIKLIDFYGFEFYKWEGLALVTIDDKPGFGEWLHGQTLPYVEGAENPTNYAYYDDFLRWKMNLGVID